MRQRGPEEGGRVFLKQWPNVLARVMHVGDSQLKNMLTLDGKLSKDKHGQKKKKPSFFNEHAIRNIIDLFCSGVPERFTFFHPQVVYFSTLPTMPFYLLIVVTSGTSSVHSNQAFMRTLLSTPPHLPSCKSLTSQAKFLTNLPTNTCQANSTL